MRNGDRLARQQAFEGGEPCSSRTSRLALALLGVALVLSLDSAAAFTELRTAGSTRSTRFYGERTRKHHPLRPPAIATRLQYRDGGEHAARVDVQIVDSNNGRWWKPLQLAAATAKKPVKKDEQQARVDDYLAFLDRRYHRLHDGEANARPVRRVPGASSGGGKFKFSALKWLVSGEQQQQREESGSAGRSTEERHEDALYALGVAGLASQQLLQQRKLPTVVGGTTDLSSFEDKMMKPKPIATDAEAATAAVASAPSSKAPSPAVYLAARLASLARRVSERRRRMLEYQSRQAASLLVGIAKALARLPAKAGKAAWNMGGGRRNVAFTLTLAATACFFVVRPVAQSVASERRM